MKILLVEDDNATVESIKFCLEIYKPGATLVTTDHGIEAVQKLKSAAFDCVLIDLVYVPIELQVLSEAL